jgi:hypothetical protein
MLLRALLVGSTCALGAMGCGPIEYLAAVPFSASGAVAEARHMDAERYAPYEITAAQEYLHKSRELAGYARYQSSVAFARKASRNAEKARQLSRDKGTADGQATAVETQPRETQR